MQSSNWPNNILIRFMSLRSDRDKALLLYALLHHSIIADIESVIGFSDESSFVSYQDKWIDLGTLIISNTEPSGLKVIFNATELKITEAAQVG